MHRLSRNLLTLFLVASGAAVMVNNVGIVQAGDKNRPAKLALSSGYALHGLFTDPPGVTSLRLTGTLDGKGGGDGVLVLDPNGHTLDLFGRNTGLLSTLARPDIQKITFARVDNDPTLYEIKGHKSDSRLFLVLPGRGTTYRLVRSGKDGKDVVVLESDTATEPARGAGTKVMLGSGYVGRPLLSAKGPRSIRVKATFDDKGGGAGTLELDPNHINLDYHGNSTSTTLLSIAEVKVTFESVKNKEKPDQAKRLYEVKGYKLADHRLYLVKAHEGWTTYRLVMTNRDGAVVEVVLLESLVLE